MVWARIRNLLRGSLHRWITRREQRHPDAVYEAAIQERLGQYRELRAAAAGVLYARRKAADTVQRLTAELARVEAQLAIAADADEDDAALMLIARRDHLREELTRASAEMAEFHAEGEAAKKNLAAFHEQIARLRDERVHIAARLATAKLRVRLHEALTGASASAADLQALEAVRAHVQQLLAEADLQRELQASAIDQRLAAASETEHAAAARAELAGLKRARKGLVPVAVPQRA